MWASIPGSTIGALKLGHISFVLCCIRLRAKWRLRTQIQCHGRNAASEQSQYAQSWIYISISCSIVCQDGKAAYKLNKWQHRGGSEMCYTSQRPSHSKLSFSFREHGWLDATLCCKIFFILMGSEKHENCFWVDSSSLQVFLWAAGRRQWLQTKILQLGTGLKQMSLKHSGEEHKIKMPLR